MALSFPSASSHRKLLRVAPALVTVNVAMAQVVRLIAVIARGMYIVGNHFQITYIINPLHNGSNIFGCACGGGCRHGFATIQSEIQSLESSKSYLCVELSFVIR
jgi:hypothetical protein